MDNKNKREIRRLGLVALIMGCIYSIPFWIMVFSKFQRCTVLGMACIPIAAISLMAAKSNFWKAPATNVKISYLGHMCFKLECDEQTVMIDPYNEGSIPGLKPVKGKVDRVLCTGHDDYTGDKIKLKKTKKPLPFEITTFETQDGKGKVYMLDNGDHRIVHLGALDCDLTLEQAQTFYCADVLMVPVGGKYTLDEDEAAELTLQLSPEYVIPMHFRAANYGLADISTAPMFPSNIKTGWQEKKEQDGEEDTHCPVVIRLAARNGKEQGLSSVEIRNREDIKK